MSSMIARNFLFHPFGSHSTEGPGSEGGLTMDIRAAGQRLQKSHLIDELRLLGKEAADPLATLSVLLELEGAFHQRTLHPGCAFDLGFGAEFLAVELCERGFVVPGVHGTHAAIHEELDDAFHLGAMMHSAVQLRLRKAGTHRIACEHLRQRETCAAATEAVEKITSEDGMRSDHGMMDFEFSAAPRSSATHGCGRRHHGNEERQRQSGTDAMHQVAA